MGKKILIILLFIFAATRVYTQEQPDFATMDQITYSLYLDKNWEALAVSGKDALGAGMDYYYLRMRLGIAYFELGRYILAARHFKAALSFSPKDKSALEYLFYCYANVNKADLAMDVYLVSPPSLKDKLKNEGLPRRSFVFTETGPQFFDLAEATEGWETAGGNIPLRSSPVINSGYFTSAGGRFAAGARSSGILAYSFLVQDKASRYRLAGKPVLMYDYMLYQNQAYASMSIFAGKGFRIIPAFHYVNVKYTTLVPDIDNVIVTLDYQEVTLQDEVAFLTLEKDFEIATAGIFGAYSTLNDKEQYQAGFNFTILPLGNLDLYLSSTFLIHQNDGKMRGIFDQLIGFRVFGPIWLELSGTTGPLENYHEDRAYVIYNIPDRIRFKSDARLILAVNGRLNLSLQYFYIARTGNIFYLEDLQGMPSTNPEMLTKEINYSNHNVLGGLLWKF